MRTAPSRPAVVVLLALVLCGLSAGQVAHADTLVAVVSETSAPEFAAAAQRFHERHPEHELVFRSSSQVEAMDGTRLRKLLDRADALIMAAIFGEPAPRLRATLALAAPKTVVPLHGEAALLSAARVDGRRAFFGLNPDDAQAALRKEAAQPALPASAVAGASADALLAQIRRYRDGYGTDNLANLFAFVLSAPAARHEVPAPRGGQDVRFLDAAGNAVEVGGIGPATVALLDYGYGDRVGDQNVHRALCAALQKRGLGCLSVLAGWGAPSLKALQTLEERQQAADAPLVGLVMLQDFVVGGGVDGQRAAASIAALDVPALKAVRLSDRSVTAWRLSESGIPDDSVHYRLAMPELQGLAQPFVVAAAGAPREDALTGLVLSEVTPIAPEVDALSARLARLHALRTRANRDKRLALIYYNHPPGRHNIGADNLDVPASLLSILRALRDAGYDTGELPKNKEALLDLLQARGVNLPEDGEALRRLAPRAATMDAARYGRYFDTLPQTAQRTLIDGPLGTLEELAAQATSVEARTLLADRVTRMLDDVTHLVEGATHPERGRALSLLEQLRTRYAAYCGGDADALAVIHQLSRALRATGIEGLRGWGSGVGNVMTTGGKMVFPGVTFGKVFVGPQPPRGWELNEELLHANLAFPPPHQYLGFYEYLREEHRADALIHVGRHSTYEFLPGRRAGLGADDFSRLVLGDLPSVYLYIVDGVGEGIQAKRRGQAILIDHLTPSLSTTPLYDDLLSLRQLVESYEAGAGVEGHAGVRALSEIRATVERLHLRKELEASMASELAARGIRYEEVDGELLVHEVGHYLTHLQERFMPHGLHVFGQAWKPAAVDRMLESMGKDAQRKGSDARADLLASPPAEAGALLHALSGGFVQPGPGNDPIRTPEVLPTGRSFHALDASVLPTKLGVSIGEQLAEKALAGDPGAPDTGEALVLWASDTVRDEGAMIAFGLRLLGVYPSWNSRGIVRGLRRVPLSEVGTRRDVTFVASGLFRDLYAHLLELLDQAVLLALDGCSRTIAGQHPELNDALEAALAPLGSARDPGEESLTDNGVGAAFVAAARALLAEGASPAQAGRDAAARIFGDAPGTFGAGINRLAERSGAWQSRDELVQTYVRRIGHAYGGGRGGQAAHGAFKRQLARTGRTFLGRASNLYGVLDNNDVFDYLGGLGMAVENVRGAPPRGFVLQHQDAQDLQVEPLPTALLGELRGRHLNPTYLKSLMAHGYAGARTMGSEFMENLWGWQVTSPQVVKSWAWDEVKAVYLDDKHGIGLSEFLSEGHNVHVKTNMQAIMLVAAHKGFWQADEATLGELSEAFARAVVEHGLPGSGHTRPDHPVMAAIRARLPQPLASEFQDRLDAALGSSAQAQASELAADPGKEEGAGGGAPRWPWVGLGALALVGLGFGLERRRKGQ